jgi:sec-independent protein translocase protein TatB
MFGIGLPELILIMVLALIVVGPEKLPELAKNIAKQILELKKTANSLKESLQEELQDEKQSWEQATSLDMKEKPLLENHGDENENKIYEPTGVNEISAEDLKPYHHGNEDISEQAEEEKGKTSPSVEEPATPSHEADAGKS